LKVINVSINKQLGAYLNDHLAGAVAGCELAERIHSQNQGTSLGTFLGQLLDDIRTDRATLEDLRERLQIQKDAIRQTGGWIVEKLSRLRFTEKLTGSSDLSRLLELETLSLGVEGKLSMWQNLNEVADVDARLTQTDFDRLIQRAQQQLEGLNRHRLEAATRAFRS